MYSNPLPLPGTTLLQQAQVTPAVTARSLELLHDQRWPLFAASGVESVDELDLVFRIEWHPPEPSIDHWHRGVTVYHVTGIFMPEGIDISGYQPTVDWSLIQQNKSFVFIKATEGLHTNDKKFVEHIENATQNEILRGCYHFFHPELDAIEQAKHFLDALDGHSFNLPPVIDAEVDKGMAPGKILDGVLAWCAYVTEQAQRQPLIYTMPSFWNLLGAEQGQMNEVAGLWVAHWGVKKPIVPTGWSRWTFWQYSADTGVAGIASPMDVNRFNGSDEDLRLYASGLAVPP